MSTPTLLSIAALTCAGLTSIAAAQPKLVFTGLIGDMASTGNGVAGFAYDAEIFQYVPYVWSRGGGYTRISGAYPQDGDIYCSSDLTALAMTTENLTDWAGLNCFDGYDTTTGELNPPLADPCPIRHIPHHWTDSTGWINTGSFDRFPDPVTGRLIGGTHCGSTISTASAISDDGRYVLANGYYTTALGWEGSISGGVCGNFLPYIYDSVTDTVTQLPVQPGTTTSRADRISADGSVITGYDLNSDDGTRRTCVWRNGVQIILDEYFGAKDNAGVNADGTILASGGSAGFVEATFPGESEPRLVRWVWNGAEYVPQNLGVPEAPEDVDQPFTDLTVTGISADGNTIIGSVNWGYPGPWFGGVTRPFIWSPAINGGVPIDFETYLASIDDPQNSIFGNGFSILSLTGISDDGNAILVQILDRRNTCVEPSQSHVSFLGGILYLDGSQVPCDAPQIGLSPKDWVEENDYYFGSALNVLASGSWPLSYQWQREDAQNPGTWIDLTDSCTNFDDSDWDYEGTNTVQLRIGQHFGGGGRSGNYRVVVSNPCGAVVSEPATLTHAVGACCIAGNACYIDYRDPCIWAGGAWLGVGATCDVDPCIYAPCCLSDGTCIDTVPSACTAAGGTPGAVGDSCFFVVCPEPCRADFDTNGTVAVPDIFAFLAAWFSQGEGADFDNNGTIAVPDIFAFLAAWFAGCPD